MTVKLKVPNADNEWSIWKVASNALVLTAFLCNAAAIVFGYLNSTNVAGLFNNTITNLSAKYYTENTPVAIIFGIIWPIIFIWTFAGSLYMVISLCLPQNQSPVKVTPSLAPNVYFLFVSFGFTSSVIWFFAFDQESLASSFTLRAVGALSFMFALFLSIVLVEQNPCKLNQSMLWVMRVVIHNGLLMISTWLVFVSSIGLTIVMLYEDSPGQTTAKLRGLFTVDNASASVLGGVGGLMVIWFLLQNFAWQKRLAYVFTDYPVFIMAFAGIVAKLSPNPADKSLIAASINLGLASLLLLARIGLSIYRFINNNFIEMQSKASDKAQLIEKDN